MDLERWFVKFNAVLICGYSLALCVGYWILLARGEVRIDNVVSVVCLALPPAVILLPLIIAFGSISAMCLKSLSRDGTPSKNEQSNRRVPQADRDSSVVR